MTESLRLPRSTKEERGRCSRWNPAFVATRCEATFSGSTFNWRRLQAELFECRSTQELDRIGCDATTPHGGRHDVGDFTRLPFPLEEQHLTEIPVAAGLRDHQIKHVTTTPL